MRNLSLVLSYEGTRYHGWQCQPNAVTVEETVRKAVERILDHSSKLYAGHELTAVSMPWVRSPIFSRQNP